MIADRQADLRLAGLAIWVDGFEFPDASDSYDSDWLNVRVRMDASGVTVKSSGSILMASDFARFRSQLASMQTKLVGQAELSGLEPDLKVVLKLRELGHMDAEIEIKPDYSQLHQFSLELDQSYLPGLIAACDQILEGHLVARRR
jgi:hypothetical protein